jgi:glycyl-tRNA synthetase beta subunit
VCHGNFAVIAKPSGNKDPMRLRQRAASDSVRVKLRANHRLKADVSVMGLQKKGAVKVGVFGLV